MTGGKKLPKSLKRTSKPVYGKPSVLMRKEKYAETENDLMSLAIRNHVFAKTKWEIRRVTNTMSFIRQNIRNKYTRTRGI